MNLPFGLPTDNLYKFMALSGVALMLAAALLAYGSFRRIQSLADALGAETSVAMVKADRIIAETLRAVDDSTLTGQERERRLMELRTPTFALGEQAVSLQARSKGLLRDLKRLSDDVDGWLIVLWTLGGVLASLGFWLWYMRVQRYQDTILRYEVEKARALASAKPSGSNAGWE
jgi:hypothetical protein